MFKYTSVRKENILLYFLRVVTEKLFLVLTKISRTVSDKQHVTYKLVLRMKCT